MFRKLFGLNHSAATAALKEPRLAIAQVMLEIARADQRSTAHELDVIRRHLAEAYQLTPPQLDVLVAEAQHQVDHAISLHDCVQSLNKNLSAEEKNSLVRGLWQVAYADGKLDAFEEALLRRLADLLYVPHGIFIREKLATLQAQ